MAFYIDSNMHTHIDLHKNTYLSVSLTSGGPKRRKAVIY